MNLIKISGGDAEDAIAECLVVIRNGGLVCFPTETFYGIAARYDLAGALGRLHALKRRAHGKALPLIIGNEELLKVLTPGPVGLEKELIKEFWPGPLTLLLKAKENLPELSTAGTGRVAVRIPGPSFALDLARRAEFPITATSANVSGMRPAQTAEDVLKYFGAEPDLLIDGGKTPGGEPSTIVHVSGDEVEILRRGAVPARKILRTAELYLNRSRPFAADERL